MKSITFQLHIVTFILVMMYPLTVHGAEENIFSEKESLQHENLFSFNFRQIAIEKALLEVSKKTGVTFLLDNELEGTISAKVNNLNREETVRRLLRKYNHAMIFSKKGENTYELTKVKVFRKGKQAQAQYVPLEGTTSAKNNGSKNNRSTSGTGNNVPEGQIGIGQQVGTQNNGSKSLNPFSADYRGRLMQELNETRQTISLLQHKIAFEEQLFNSKIAELQQDLTSPGEDKQKTLEDIVKYEDAKKRAELNNYQNLITAQKNSEELQKDLAASLTTAEQKQNITTRVNRQAGTAKPALPSEKTRSARSTRESRE